MSLAICRQADGSETVARKKVRRRHEKGKRRRITDRVVVVIRGRQVMLCTRTAESRVKSSRVQESVSQSEAVRRRYRR